MSLKNDCLKKKSSKILDIIVGVLEVLFALSGVILLALSITICTIVITYLIITYQLEFDFWQFVNLCLVDPWRFIVAVSILASLWAQNAMTLFFANKKYLVIIQDNRHMVSVFFDILFSLLMTGAVLIVLANYSNTYKQSVFNLVYLFFIVIYDAIYFFRATKLPDNEIVKVFKKNLKDLIFHIDVPFFLFIFISTLLIYYLPFFADDEKYKYLAVIVGAQLILTVLLILILLIRWEYNAYKLTMKIQNNDC